MWRAYTALSTACVSAVKTVQVARSRPGAKGVMLRGSAGFRTALEERGLSLPPERVLRISDYFRKDGVGAMTRILGERWDLDAIFCPAGDIAAAGMLSVARKRGVRVPDDVALIGFDDNALAAISEPPLATVRQPVDLMADEAFRLATTQRDELFARPRRVVFPPELVVRRST